MHSAAPQPYRLAPSWQTRVLGLRRPRGPRDAKTAHWSRDGLGLNLLKSATSHLVRTPTPNYLRLASPNRGKYFISSQVRHVAIGNGIAAVALSITHGHALAHMPMHLYTHALYTGINTSCPLVCRGTSR